MFFCLNLCLLLHITSPIFCDAFELDSSFNQPNGYAYINPGITYDESYALSQAVALDENNNIILAGFVNAQNSANNNVVQQGISVVRYLPNGQLDESFNASQTPGYVVTFVDFYNNGANAVAIQSDGKIIVAGYAGSESTQLMVARYTPTGQLDTEFNNTGFYIGSLLEENIYGIAIQSDGKILLIGGNYNLFVYRFNSNGTVDTNFAENGKKSISIPSGYDASFGRGIVCLQDGSIVGAGYFGNGSVGKMLVLFKLTATGGINLNFGDEGFVTMILGTALSCDQIKVDTFGKLVIGGTVTNEVTGKADALVVRYMQNGTLDSSFNNGLGYVITQVSDKSLYSYGVIIFDRTPENYPGYGIFYINCFNNNKIVVIKYNYDGSLNLDFNNSGMYIKKMDNGSISTDAVMQEDQKIVISGRLYQSGTDNFLAMRFLNNVVTNQNISSQQAVDVYGYNQAYIYDFLALDSYAQVILNQQVRQACLESMDRVIQLYVASYEFQENFNYVLNLNLIFPAMLYIQQLLLGRFPDESVQINKFFALIFLRIKLLVN